MDGTLAMSRDELIREVNQLQWVHAIDLGDGVVTPGLWGGHNPVLWKFMDTIDFRGKRVLDIGCWDGLWSFEAEKRGAAEVYATDLISHRTFQLPTFELAARALGSRVKYFPHVSVYDVEQLGIDDFDIVLYAGVYYHIKDPLRSFSTLRRVLKEGGILLAEGAVLLPEEASSAPPPPQSRVDRVRQRLARWIWADEPTHKSPAPVVPPSDCFANFYYRNQFCGDDSNWWVPTMSCLRQWVECNFFEIEQEDSIRFSSGNHRGQIIARAVRRKDERYIRPESELAAFDLNVY